MKATSRLGSLFCCADEYRLLQIPSDTVSFVVDDLCFIPLYSNGSHFRSILLFWTSLFLSFFVLRLCLVIQA